MFITANFNSNLSCIIISFRETCHFVSFCDIKTGRNTRRDNKITFYMDLFFFFFGEDENEELATFFLSVECYLQGSLNCLQSVVFQYLI